MEDKGYKPTSIKDKLQSVNILLEWHMSRGSMGGDNYEAYEEVQQHLRRESNRNQKADRLLKSKESIDTLTEKGKWVPGGIAELQAMMVEYFDYFDAILAWTIASGQRPNRNEYAYCVSFVISSLWIYAVNSRYVWLYYYFCKQSK